MSDDEGMGSMPDNVLLRVAQKQVEELRDEVKAGRKAARLTRFQVRLLAVVCTILLVVVGVVAEGAANQSDLYSKLHQQSIESCQFGNQQRAGEQKVWDTFIDLILQGNTDPANAAKGKQFKAYVAQVEAPRNCQQAYSTADSAYLGS